MAAWNRLSKRTALAVLVGLAITSSEASAGVNVIDGAWVTGFLPFSEAAGIVDNRIMLGPADADSEIEAGEGRVFVKLRLQFDELSADDRSDAARTLATGSPVVRRPEAGVGHQSPYT